MRDFILKIIFGVLVVFSANAFAEVDAATAENLMKKSGLWHQLESYSDQMKASIKPIASQCGQEPTAAELNRLDNAIDAAYAGERNRAAVRIILMSDLSQSHTASLMSWYDTPLAKKITELEIASSSSVQDQEKYFRSAVETLEKTPKFRQQILQQLIDASDFVNLFADMSTNTALAVYKGISKTGSKPPITSYSQLKSTLELQKPQIKKSFGPVALAMFSSIYAPLSDAELKKYLAFTRSTAGQHYLRVSSKATMQAIIQAAENLGKDLPLIKDAANI